MQLTARQKRGAKRPCYRLATVVMAVCKLQPCTLEQIRKHLNWDPQPVAITLSRLHDKRIVWREGRPNRKERGANAWPWVYWIDDYGAMFDLLRHYQKERARYEQTGTAAFPNYRQPK